MNRTLWNSWFNEPYYKLLLKMRKLKYGRITIEINEGVPVKIHEVVQSHDVNKMKIEHDGQSS